MREVHGQDIVLTPDSQDGQLLAIWARAFYDAFSTAAAVYNAQSPSTAVGVGLSRVVKINGISRRVPSYSTVDVRIVGATGTVVEGGIVGSSGGSQAENVRWSVPNFIIPFNGELTLTATAMEPGAFNVSAGSIDSIFTPTLGWQTVENPTASVPGAPVEADSQLRVRQTVSTMIPSQTTLEGLVGAVAALPGVSRYAAVVNSGDATDAEGIPGHHIGLIVEGGDATEIATVIAQKKAPGTGTVGDIETEIKDAYGIPHKIKFYRPITVPITVDIDLEAFEGYTVQTEANIQQAVADYINGLDIGDNVYLRRVYVPANLTGAAQETFNLTSLKIARDGFATAAADIEIAFNEAVECDPSDVVITADD
jgi:uncharacterized phage protein gp47/JayE